jgi:hypothetical protein
MAPAADAGLIYSGVQNFTIATNASVIYYGTFDLNFDGIDDFRLYLNRFTFLGVGTSARASLSTLGGNNGILAATNTAPAFFARRLATGAIISAGAGNFTSAFAGLRDVTSGGSVFGAWQPSENGLAGVRFTIGGQDHFGWIRIHVGEQDDVPNAITALDWAYESEPGVGIQAGSTQAVPEPGTLALLATGAAGLLAWRRRRQGASNHRQ